MRPGPAAERGADEGQTKRQSTTEYTAAATQHTSAGQQHHANGNMNMSRWVRRRSAWVGGGRPVVGLSEHTKIAMRGDAWRWCLAAVESCCLFRARSRRWRERGGRHDGGCHGWFLPARLVGWCWRWCTGTKRCARAGGMAPLTLDWQAGRCLASGRPLQAFQPNSNCLQPRLLVCAAWFSLSHAVAHNILPTKTSPSAVVIWAQDLHWPPFRPWPVLPHLKC